MWRSVWRPGRSVSVRGAETTAAEVSLAPGTSRLKISTSSGEPGLICTSYRTCSSGSTNRRCSRIHRLAVVMAISSMGIRFPFIPDVARSPKISRMGSVTRPPPRRISAFPATRKPLSMLWWRMTPNCRRYSRLSSMLTRSMIASQMESGWPCPFRSTISTSCSDTGLPESTSTVIDRTSLPPVSRGENSRIVGSLLLRRTQNADGRTHTPTVRPSPWICFLRSALCPLRSPGFHLRSYPGTWAATGKHGHEHNPGHEPADMRPPGDSAPATTDRSQPIEKLQEEPQREEHDRRNRDGGKEDTEKGQRPDTRAGKEHQVRTQHTGDSPAGTDERKRRRPVDKRVRQDRDDPDERVEDQEAAVTHSIFHVVGKDPQVEHVAEQVEPTAVHEQGRDQRGCSGHQPAGCRQRRGSRAVRADEALPRRFWPQPIRHVQEDGGAREDQENRDDRSRRRGVVVAQGNHAAALASSQRTSSTPSTSPSATSNSSRLTRGGRRSANSSMTRSSLCPDSSTCSMFTPKTPSAAPIFPSCPGRSAITMTTWPRPRRGMRTSQTLNKVRTLTTITVVKSAPA